MGIEAVYVLPVKDHLSVFNCHLCSNLVSLDGYVTKPCGHCFCRGCFRTWTKTQHPKTSACGCPKCGVSLASGESDRVVNWLVMTLVQAEPLVHRMLSQVKIVCPCRSSARICYWTGDYAELKQHISTTHAQPAEANEVSSKSGMTLTSASEHQKSTARSRVEAYPSDKTKLNKSEHIRKSSPHQDKRGSSRMPRRRSVSMSEMATKSNSPATNTFDVIHSRHDPGDGLDIDFTRSSLVRNVSMGCRLTETKPGRSAPTSNEGYKNQSPSEIDSTKETMTTPNVAKKTGGRTHHSDAVVDTSESTLKSIETSLTRVRSGDPAYRLGEASANKKGENSITCQSKELVSRHHDFTNSLSQSVEKAAVDTSANRVCNSLQSTRSEFQEGNVGLRKKQSLNTPKSASAPTASAAATLSSHSEHTKRSLRRLVDKMSATSTRQSEDKQKGSHSTSPVRKHLNQSLRRRSTSLTPPTSKGKETRNATRIEQRASLACKEGKYMVAHELYTTAIDVCISTGSSTDVDMELLASWYGNRAQVSLQQGMIWSCLEDCNVALSLNKHLPRTCLCKASALNEMGLFAEACVALSSGLKNNPGVSELENELASCKKLRKTFALIQSLVDVKKYDDALMLLSETPQTLRHSVVLRCKAELGLGKASQVLDALNPEILKKRFHG